MIQAMWTGNTGLNANQYWLSVISDNIANVNTIGYKYERASFEDIITNSLTTFNNNVPKNMEVGGGAIIASTQKIFTQGNFSQTNVPTDLALEGQGFFMVADNNGTIYYTRNGQFRLNANGDLVNTLGLKIQGWTLDDNGNMIGALGSINIPYSQPPKTTTQISIEPPSNLDSRSNTITSAFNPADSTTFNYVNTINVYDSLGNPHIVSFYFQKSAANTWNVYAYADNNLTSQVGTTTLNFDTNGNLTSGSPLTLNIPVTTGATSPLSISVDFSKLKQVASDFLFSSNQDGNSKGDLLSISIAEDGVIKGTYSNGTAKNIARLAVAVFKDTEMLVREGEFLYIPNQQTFTPIVTPGGILNKIRSGMLEMSNVDISREFINLIVAQRAYQANARVITTSDQVLQEAMNIKR